MQTITRSIGVLFLFSAMTEASLAGDSLLPFMGDEARAKGYDLPAPVGLNVGYMHIRQGIDVNSIQFNGLALQGPFGQKIPLPADLFKVDAGQTRQYSNTTDVRLDAWVLPFLNLYAVAGRTHGYSTSDISVNVRGVQPSGMQNLKFRLDYRGTTYGGGLTLASGVGNWFSSVDANYTRTNLDVLDGDITAWVVTPRIGYQFNFAPLIGETGYSAVRVWVGGMYQNIQQTFRGRLSSLKIPGQLAGLVDTVNVDNSARFEVKQQLSNPWNMVAGAQFEASRNLNILTEVGFGGRRDSVFVSGEFRF